MISFLQGLSVLSLVKNYSKKAQEMQKEKETKLTTKWNEMWKTNDKHLTKKTTNKEKENQVWMNFQDESVQHLRDVSLLN